MVLPAPVQVVEGSFPPGPQSGADQGDHIELLGQPQVDLLLPLAKALGQLPLVEVGQEPGLHLQVAPGQPVREWVAIQITGRAATDIHRGLAWKRITAGAAASRAAAPRRRAMSPDRITRLETFFQPQGCKKYRFFIRSIAGRRKARAR